VTERATSREPQATIAEFTERELVARISTRLPPAPPWMPIGIGDDAAVVEPEKNRLEVLTVDAVVEGVHFDRAFTPARAIGHRALAVNLSDLAAMGAVARVCLVSMALPPSLPIDEFDAIVDGLTALAREHGAHVAGGNLTRSPGPLMIDITLTGTAKRRHVLTRSGARPGDELYVTGTVGGAAAGLAMLKENPHAAEDAGNSCVARYLYPRPRIRAGVLVARNRAATAGVDLSDGLADAVAQIAVASGVGAVIDGEALPIEPAARDWFNRRGDDAVRAAIVGGDDYELLLAVPSRAVRRLTAARRHGGVPLTRIGICTESREMLLNCGSGAAAVPLPAGFHHFR
jgi:thiamine-monophosphate kinase